MALPPGRRYYRTADRHVDSNSTNSIASHIATFDLFHIDYHTFCNITEKVKLLISHQYYAFDKQTIRLAKIASRYIVYNTYKSLVNAILHLNSF